VIQEPSIDKTKEIMAQPTWWWATGGMPLVKSAYSSGKPSYGVGAGNVQVLLDRHIDYDEAAQKWSPAGRSTMASSAPASRASSTTSRKEEVFRAFERALPTSSRTTSARRGWT
jgi:succinate-semialdehyde dehydrogenase